jgi:hypothetical protein
VNAIRSAASGALMLAMVGCAVFRAPEDEPPVAPPEPEVPGMPAEPEVSVPPPTTVEPVRTVAPVPESERLLEYFRQVRKLGGVELGREYEVVRVAYTRSRSDFDRLRFAMVLSLPETALIDETRALELLEPMIRNQNSPLHGLAILLYTFAQERRRLEKSVQGMQQKLDALKAMERNLIERKR